VRKTIELGLEE